MFSPKVMCSLQVNKPFPLSLDVITTDTSKTAGDPQRRECQLRQTVCTGGGGKKIHPTIMREGYRCTNSITCKEDLVNIASDPKLIGVMEAGDPS